MTNNYSSVTTVLYKHNSYYLYSFLFLYWFITVWRCACPWTSL